MNPIPVTDETINVSVSGGTVTLRYALDKDQITYFRLMDEYGKLFPENAEKEKSWFDTLSENAETVIGNMDKMINLFVVNWEGGKLPKFDNFRTPASQLRLNNKMAIWHECIKKSGELTFGGTEEQKN